MQQLALMSLLPARQVPQDKTGAITNTQRIVGAIPSIELALSKGAQAVVLMSHLGRPDGKKNASMTLKPVADKLSEIMGKPVIFVPECVGPEAEAVCKAPAAGSSGADPQLPNFLQPAQLLCPKSEKLGSLPPWPPTLGSRLATW